MERSDGLLGLSGYYTSGCTINDSSYFLKVRFACLNRYTIEVGVMPSIRFAAP